MEKKMKRYLLFGFIVLLFGISGCSNKIKISGTVTFPDGEPVNFGQVCFDGNGKTYYGYLDEKGRYSPGELKDGDGIPYGTYKVWLAGTVLSEEILVGKGEEAESSGYTKDTYRVAEKYTFPQTTDVIFEVKHDGSKKFDFTVERPNKPQNKSKR
jgi:hypothetical protein